MAEDNSPFSTADFAVVKNDLSHMGRLLGELKREVTAIGTSIEKLIGIEARQLQLQETQARTLTRLESLEDMHRALDKAVPERLSQRLGAIENDIPALKQTKYWVYGAITALVAGSFWGLITGHLVIVSK